GRQVLVRSASAIEADWLLELFTDAIRDATDVLWNDAAGRVDVVRRMTYGALVLEEKSANDAPPELVADALADAAMRRGIRTLVDADELDRIVARLAFLRAQSPSLDVPVVDDAYLRTVIRDAALGWRSLQDLRNVDLLGAVRAR